MKVVVFGLKGQVGLAHLLPHGSSATQRRAPDEQPKQLETTTSAGVGEIVFFKYNGKETNIIKQNHNNLDTDITHLNDIM